MLATVHALVGASIANVVPNPAIGLSLSLTSHFIIDCIPHWDFGTHWRKRPKFITGTLSIADTVIGITLAYLLFAGKVSTGYLLLSIALSLLPDWLETPWYIFFAKAKKLRPSRNAGIWEQLAFFVYKLENRFHAKTDAPLGIFTQIVALAFFLLLLR